MIVSIALCVDCRTPTGRHPSARTCWDCCRRRNEESQRRRKAKDKAERAARRQT